MEAVYKSVDDNVRPNRKTNIFIAAFTTCYVRLKFYSYLTQLNKQVLYYDTDSVIYRWKEGQPSILIGNFLGEMTDELEGDVIQTFISGGAKNYAYKTVSIDRNNPTKQVCSKTVCKVCSFTLNVRGMKVLNFDSIKKNIILKKSVIL